MKSLENLILGSTVNFVLRDGTVRPMILTKIDQDSPNVNGIVHFDGPNDAKRLDPELRTEQLRTGTLWVEDIPYSEAPTTLTRHPVPGTWHLPPKLVAAYAAVAA